jgi:hypothetical protein
MIPYYRLMTKCSGLGDSTELSRVGLSQLPLLPSARNAPPLLPLPPRLPRCALTLPGAGPVATEAGEAGGESEPLAPGSYDFSPEWMDRALN